MKWEYKVKFFGSGEMQEIDLETYLNQQGQNRWELVAIHSRTLQTGTSRTMFTVIFKRQKQAP